VTVFIARPAFPNAVSGNVMPEVAREGPGRTMLDFRPIYGRGSPSVSSMPDRSLRPTDKLHVPPRLGQRHCLVVWLDGSARVVSLPQRGSVVVGRGDDAGIRVDASTVSRRHAELSLGPGVVTVADLGSQNGTRVNGERIGDTRPLAYGDILSLGEVTAVFSEERRGSAERALAEIEGSDQARTLDVGGCKVLLADAAMMHVYAQIERLAPTEVSLLILGETGTGKELAASALHFWSRRKDKPLLAINCAALPDNLAESELFGYERGAFSGAVTSKPGRLESAPGGTVFFDEVGDLSLAIQAKLLRTLETRRITRLGSVEERPIDVRVVAATHRDLEAEVAAGGFRKDLYYRLTVGVVRLPPLRERPRELPLLARRFLADACLSQGRPPLSLDEAAVDRLRSHPWPGNVRELKNVMEYLAATAIGDAIDPGAIFQRLGVSNTQPPSPAAEAGPPGSEQPLKSLAEATSDFERQTIEAALRAAGGNKTRAAKLLGIPLRTFMTKIKRYGL
jgi:DNA-binding NtrC family response regulator